MANILSAEDVCKSYGEKVLVDHISFGIDEGERIGLIGINGTGKSSLLKIIAGVDSPDSGSITLASAARVHYLPQEPEFEQGANVLSAVFHGNTHEMQTIRDYEAALEQVNENPNDLGAQERLIRLQSRMDDLHAWEMEYEAKTILTRLGITDFQAVVGTLSGGQRKRIALARALIQPADLLILDEPTNHIDDESAAWLENYLAARKGALLMVTHDRYFLDRVANRIFELHQGRLYQYPGNYNAFLEAKLQRETEQAASEDKRQNFLRNELKWIQRGARARGTKQKARTERYYDVLNQNTAPTQESIDLSSVSSRLGKTVIELQDVSKGYNGPSLIDHFSYIVLRDDRIGIIGPNGMGKSTLLKLMAQQMTPDDGSVVVGSTVKIGYFSQEHEEMPLDMKVIDYIRDEAEYIETADGESITAAQMLERFLFPGHLQWTPISKLSGGEKRRLSLLKTIMSAPNVLLLDEPTNDLDIPTLSILESYLDDFAGSVIVVSHDRYFLDRVCEKIFAFEGHGVISVHFGNFSEYMSRQKENGAPSSTTQGNHADTRAKLPDKSAAGPVRGNDDQPEIPKPKKLKFSWSEQKEYETIDSDIANVEESLQLVSKKLEAAGSNYGLVQELYNEQQELEQKLNHLLERWTYLNELAEAIEKSQNK
ncbi:ABC-F family ATP-binding cassette domain-containing protein [Alicyclobacillus ferrooxydans]|uniref:ABC transporter n=1 Tax=Alicyclobacillus ferrooxydans TaxID=471514 RepID=A0A0P9D538_9BACL|nr:ABC-F family ATP-binding cassette domain-containing protein [Alicyclobacillus ferrooxydans]KPV44555.1 ABC transporter [Alicyclobacillus ferrooxydans]